MATTGQEALGTGGRKSGKRLMDTLDVTVERMREDPLRLISWLVVQRWRSPFIYAFIWGLTWLAVGLSLWFNNWTALGPIVFIGLGLILLGLLLPRPER